MEGSSKWKSVYFVVAVIAMVMVVGMRGKAEGSISCSTVVSDLTPCLSYVSGSSAKPTKGCCNGIKTLNTAAKTTADRQDVCNCIKSVASAYSQYYDRASKLPSLCGVNLGFTVTPSLDCSRYVEVHGRVASFVLQYICRSCKRLMRYQWGLNKT